MHSLFAYSPTRPSSLNGSSVCKGDGTIGRTHYATDSRGTCSKSSFQGTTGLEGTRVHRNSWRGAVDIRTARCACWIGSARSFRTARSCSTIDMASNWNSDAWYVQDIVVSSLTYEALVFRTNKTCYLSMSSAIVFCGTIMDIALVIRLLSTLLCW